MSFVKGKYYGFKGKEAMVMYIVEECWTHTWGTTFIAEVNIRGSLPALRAVGMKDEHEEGWQEIDAEIFLDVSAHWQDEFAEKFDASIKMADERKAKAEVLGIDTAFRKVVRHIDHPETHCKVIQLVCGHTARFTKEEWAKILEDGKEPKVGTMQLCGTCNLQNMAMSQNMLIEEDKMKHASPEAQEQGKAIQFNAN